MSLRIPSYLRFNKRRLTRPYFAKRLQALGLKADWQMLGRLRRVDPINFERLITLVEKVKQERPHLRTLLVARPETIPLTILDRFEKRFDEKFILRGISSCARGTKLDLRDLHVKLHKLNCDQNQELGPSMFPGLKRDPNKLLTAVLREAQAFDRIAADPSSSIEDVFTQIDRGKKDLGFLNVAVYRPKVDEPEKWILTSRTANWTEDLGKYDPEKGGSEPTGTLKSVLEGSSPFYYLDLCDRSTFNAQGIYFDDESAANDFAHAVGHKSGSGKKTRGLLYIPIRSGDSGLFSRYGNEGVVLFHNQVAKRRVQKSQPNPPPLLPEDEEEAEQKMDLLQRFYVGKIVDAIETIRRREMAEAARVETVMPPEPPKPFGYHSDDGSKLTRVQRYVRQSVIKQIRLRDKRKVNLEIIKPPQGMSIKEYFASQEGGFKLLQQDCRIVSALSTGVNKDASVDQYLSAATELIIARDAETNVFMGYVAAQPMRISGIPSVFIWGDYSMPQYHHLGLGTAMGAESVKQAKKMLDVAKHSRIYILFRTWNPAAYKITKRGDFSLFPLPSHDGTAVLREPTPIENRLFTYVAQNLLGTNIDVDTAVLAGMIEPASKINWLGKPAIDTFFREVVKVQEGRALLVTSRTPRFFELLHPLREVYIRFGIVFKLFLRGLPGIGRMFQSEQTQVDWGKYFKAYDVLREFIPYQQVLDRIVTLLELDDADLKCLDLGSGTGNMSLAVKETGVNVISVENSDGGIAIHRQKDAEAKIHNVDLDQEETDFLPFADHSIDRISANHVVNYIKNRQTLYEELKRVLRPDGIIVASILNEGFSPLKVLLGHMTLEYKEFRKTRGIFSSLKGVYANFNRMNPRLTVVGAANKVIVDGAAGGSYALLNEKQIRQEWEAAGFDVISIEPHYAGQDYIVKLRPRLV